MRKDKNIYLILIVVLLICITIGYAVLNSTLNINGKSNISKNTWDIHFDNIKVTNGSVEAVKLPSIEDSTTVGFEVALNLPGDFYEFTVDVVNSGTINAMIENIEKTTDLTQQQSKYLNYIIQYENGEEITTKQIVNSNESIKLKVRVEYKKDITSADLPANTETINFGFNVLYVQSNDPEVGGSSRPEEIITDMYYYSDITTALAAVTAGTVEESVNADETSGTIGVPFGYLAAAISIAVIRFSLPSVRNAPIGNWLPVKTTGLLRFSSIKLNAEAVYAIVSVPCKMTKPSKRS